MRLRARIQNGYIDKWNYMKVIKIINDVFPLQ